MHSLLSLRKFVLVTVMECRFEELPDKQVFFFWGGEGGREGHVLYPARHESSPLL
jgi:hypothetical protein